jgi:hypothetical protein
MELSVSHCSLLNALEVRLSWFHQGLSVDESLQSLGQAFLTANPCHSLKNAGILVHLRIAAEDLHLAEMVCVYAG